MKTNNDTHKHMINQFKILTDRCENQGMGPRYVECSLDLFKIRYPEIVKTVEFRDFVKST